MMGDLWDTIFGNGNGDAFPMDIPDPYEQAPATSEEKSFWDTVAQFKRKADEFWSTYKRLEELEPVAMSTAATRDSYNKVMYSGQNITGNIENAADRIQAAISWGAMSGIEPKQLGGLGIWPIAIIAAAIAAMSMWLTDAGVEVYKLENMKAMIGKGMSPTAARDVVQSGGGGGFGTAFGTELGKAAGFAAVVGLGVFYLMKKGRR